MTLSFPMRKVDVVDLAVGAKLRQRRRELDITQGDLADKIGVSPQQIQKYESGFNRIAASRLVKLAQVLDVYPSYFFNVNDFGDLQQINTPEEAELLRNFKMIEDKRHRRILQDLAAQLSRS